MIRGGSVNIVNPYSAELIYLNFHPHEVVSRYRDPQLKWVEIIHICLICEQAFASLDATSCINHCEKWFSELYSIILYFILTAKKLFF